MKNDIFAILREKIPDGNVEKLSADCFRISPDYLLIAAEILYKNENCFFDRLTDIAAVHHLAEKKFSIFYTFYSFPFQNKLQLTTDISDEKPELDSLTKCWLSADWFEREVFDMQGITFRNHPDLRRILMPNDWQGYPLRKDYTEQDDYHGIKIKY
jgi:NADH-quinone oxidoreductase subunit C